MKTATTPSTTWIAVNGAEFLTSMNLTGLPVVIGFTLLTGLLNLIIFSGSAQWAIPGPNGIPVRANTSRRTIHTARKMIPLQHCHL